MNDELKLLCELQVLHDKEREVKEKLIKLNKSLNEIKVNFDNISNKKNEIMKELSNKRNNLKDKELELQTLYENIKKSENELFSSKSYDSKYLSELENKVKEMKTLKENIEVNVLEGMDEVEKLEIIMKEKETKLNNIQLELIEVEKEYKLADEDSKKILDEIGFRRNKIRSEISPSYILVFDRAFMIGQGKAISKVEVDRCSSCGTNVPLNSLQKIKKSQDILITCENCGRILVIF